MNITEFRQVVADHPDHDLRFVLDNGHAIAAHFHITEVGRVEKRFVDCGGKPRQTTTCALQTLVAGDTEHRLTTTKLAKILQLVDTLGLPADVPVEVEHQGARYRSIRWVRSLRETVSWRLTWSPSRPRA